MQENSGRQIRREIKGGQLGERVGKKVGEKVGEKTGEKVGESLGEIDKLNLCPTMIPFPGWSRDEIPKPSPWLDPIIL